MKVSVMGELDGAIVDFFADRYIDGVVKETGYVLESDWEHLTVRIESGKYRGEVFHIDIADVIDDMYDELYDEQTQQLTDILFDEENDAW